MKGKGHPQTNTLGEQNIRDDEISEETREEDGTHDEYDQDSSISFDDDDEDSTASQEDNLEDWIEHVKSTEVADEQMLTHSVGWNLALIISTKTQWRAGRPAKRWEDDLNDFVKGEDTEATQSNDLENNNTLLVTTMNINEWEKQDNTPNTLSTTEEPSNNMTSPATPRGRPRALRRH